MNAVVDSKPYVEADPLIGYRYVAGTRMSLPRPGGGNYDFAVNQDGIRGDRDYARTKPAGVTRIIVLGDSMAAGQFVSNQQRFSELLERRHPALEVMNLALEGSGTDQQILLYEHVGLRYEHDLVLILPFLQNIRRNLAGAREAIDPATGNVVLRPKPRFELAGEELVFHPVGESSSAVDEPRTNALQLKGTISRLPGAAFLKRLLYHVVPWEPFPEYRDPASAGWQLMAALIKRLKSLAGARPVVVAPVFYSNYVRYRMALNYRDRFASLSSTPGVYPVDLLPHFKTLGSEAVWCFQDPFDMHFSADGHLVLANAIEHELAQRGLLARP